FGAPGAFGLGSTPDVSLDGTDGIGVRFGWTVASAGDVDGDGYGDVVIGELAAPPAAGHAFVYRGAASPPPMSIPGIMLDDPDGAGTEFGVAVSGAGDVDGDGDCEVVVGADRTSMDTGRAHVFRGSATGLASMPSPSLVGPDPGARFGA